VEQVEVSVHSINMISLLLTPETQSRWQVRELEWNSTFGRFHLSCFFYAVSFQSFHLISLLLTTVLLGIISGILVGVLLCVAVANLFAFVQIPRLGTITSKANQTAKSESGDSGEVKNIIRRIQVRALLLAIDAIILIVVMRLHLPEFARTVVSNQNHAVDGLDLLLRLSTVVFQKNRSGSSPAI
jgi:hypothetical protein